MLDSNETKILSRSVATRHETLMIFVASQSAHMILASAASQYLVRSQHIRVLSYGKHTQEHKYNKKAIGVQSTSSTLLNKREHVGERKRFKTNKYLLIPSLLLHNAH